MNEGGQFELLDILTVLSFALQLENQGKIIRITDIQNEVNRAVSEIHGHLEEQDRILKLLLERTEKHENN